MFRFFLNNKILGSTFLTHLVEAIGPRIQLLLVVEKFMFFAQICFCFTKIPGVIGT